VDKPRFLLIFISVIAGLSAFAVILIAGAVAIRRRADSALSSDPTTAETDSDKEPEKGREYTDPLLRWMDSTSDSPAGNGHSSDHKDWTLPPPTVAEEAPEPEMEPMEPEDLVHADEAVVSSEEAAEEEPSEAGDPLSVKPVQEVANVEQDEAYKPAERVAEPPSEPPLVSAESSILPIAKREEKSNRKRSRSSRSRSRRKGKRRRRRR
jgi:hypothetical protein